MKEKLKQSEIISEIKRVDKDGNEYWIFNELVTKLDDLVFNSCYEMKVDDVSWFLFDVKKPIIRIRGRDDVIRKYNYLHYDCYLIVQNNIVILGTNHFRLVQIEAFLEKQRRIVLSSCF